MASARGRQSCQSPERVAGRRPTRRDASRRAQVCCTTWPCAGSVSRGPADVTSADRPATRAALPHVDVERALRSSVRAVDSRTRVLSCARVVRSAAASGRHESFASGANDQPRSAAGTCPCPLSAPEYGRSLRRIVSGGSTAGTDPQPATSEILMQSGNRLRPNRIQLPLPAAKKTRLEPYEASAQAKRRLRPERRLLRRLSGRR